MRFSSFAFSAGAEFAGRIAAGKARRRLRQGLAHQAITANASLAQVSFNEICGLPIFILAPNGAGCNLRTLPRSERERCGKLR
ncbi:MAG: hypothetical protein LBS59_00705 [Puniceicoccales bacterium]|nr:hypothetical protein [Puniceicoccales bacterium]